MLATAVWADALAEFSDRLLRLNYAHSTRLQYTETVRRFLAVFPDLSPERVTPEHVEHFLYGLKVSPRTFCSRLEELRAFFRWAREQKRLLKADPCAGVEKPRWKKRLRPAPSFEEFEAVRRRCKALEEAAILELLYFSGLRLNEFRHLKVRDVDLRTRRAFVRGKGDKDRIVVFPQRVADCLRLHAWLAGALHPDGWLFPAPKRRRLPRGEEWIEKTLAGLGREAGLPYPLRAHTLRHGWVRLMKVRGVPLEVTAKLAGHNSIKTTADLYGQLSTDDLQTVYDGRIF